MWLVSWAWDFQARTRRLINRAHMLFNCRALKHHSTSVADRSRIPESRLILLKGFFRWPNLRSLHGRERWFMAKEILVYSSDDAMLPARYACKTISNNSLPRIRPYGDRVSHSFREVQLHLDPQTHLAEMYVRWIRCNARSGVTLTPESPGSTFHLLGLPGWACSLTYLQVYNLQHTIPGFIAKDSAPYRSLKHLGDLYYGRVVVRDFSELFEQA